MSEKINSSPQQNMPAPNQGTSVDEQIREVNENNARIDRQIEELLNMYNNRFKTTFEPSRSASSVETTEPEIGGTQASDEKSEESTTKTINSQIREINENNARIDQQIKELKEYNNASVYNDRFGAPEPAPELATKPEEPVKLEEPAKVEEPVKPEEPKTIDSQIREINENNARIDQQIKELKAYDNVSAYNDRFGVTEPAPKPESKPKDEPVLPAAEPKIEPKEAKEQEKPEEPAKPEEPVKPEEPAKSEEPVKAEKSLKEKGDDFVNLVRTAMKSNKKAEAKVEPKAEPKTEAESKAKPETETKAKKTEATEHDPADEQYVATRTEINQKSIENMINSMAADAQKRYDNDVNKIFKDNKAKASLAKKIARIAAKTTAGVVGLGGLFIAGGFAGVGIAAIAGYAGVAAKNQFRRTKQFQAFRDAAAEAIDTTGNLDSAEGVVEAMREKMVKKVTKGSKFTGWFKALDSNKARAEALHDAKNYYEAGQGSEKYLLERARDYNAGLINKTAIGKGEETDVTDEAALEKIGKIKGAYSDFVIEITQTRDEKALAEAKARLREKINSFEEEDLEDDNDYDDDYDDYYGDNKEKAEQNKFVTDDYDELADRLIKDLSGKWIGREMFSDEAKKNAADKFIDMKLKINIAKMNAGLDVPEKIALSQRLASMHPGAFGLIVGTVVGLTPEAIRVARSKVLPKKFEGLSKFAANATKIGLLTGFAAIFAYATTHRSAKYDVEHRTAMGALGRNHTAETEAQTATGGEEGDEEGDEEGGSANKAKEAPIDFERLNVNNATFFLNEYYEALKDPQVSLEDKVNVCEDALYLVAMINAKRDLQKEENVNLFESDGWQGVAKGKAELARAQGRLERAVREYYGENYEKSYDAAYEEVYDETGDKIDETKAALKKEIRKKALKSAAIAGGVAFAMSTAMTAAAEKGWLQKAEEWRQGVKQNIKNMFASGAATQTGANAAGTTTGSGENQGGEDTTDNGEDINSDNQPTDNTDRNSGNTSRVIFEKDPDGGYTIAIDNDGDGVIGEGDSIMVGEGAQSGFDPTNSEQVAAVREMLNARGFDMQITQTESIEQAEITIKDLINSADNSTDTDILKNLSEETRTRYVLHRPEQINYNAGNDANGTYYRVRIDGDLADGTKLAIDVDGDGPCKAQLFDIVNHEAVIPGDIVDQTGARPTWFGYAAAGEIDDDGRFIRGAMEAGRNMLNADDIVKAGVSNITYNVSILDQATGAEVSVFRLGETVERVGGVGLAAAEAAAVAGTGTAETLQQAEYGEAAHEYSSINQAEGKVVVDTTREPIKLYNGDTIERLKFEGEYNGNTDTSIYDRNPGDMRFAPNDYDWDYNNNGRLDDNEVAGVLRNIMENTANNSVACVQNADLLGILEDRELMAEKVFGSVEVMDDFYQKCGILDGKPDTLHEISLLHKGIVGSPYMRPLINLTLDVEADRFAEVESVDALKITNRDAMSYNHNTGELQKVSPDSARTGFDIRGAGGKSIFAGGAIGRELLSKGERLLVMINECTDQAGAIIGKIKPTPTITPPPENTPTPPPENTPTPPPENTPTPPPENTPTPPPEDTPTPTITPPPTNTPTPPPENTPTPTVTPPPTNTPTPTLVPKDESHMRAVDEAIAGDEGIADSYNLNVETKFEHLDADSGNSLPDSDGLSGDKVTNELAQQVAATPSVSGTPSTVLEEVSSGNDYSQNVATPSITPIVLPDEEAQEATNTLAETRAAEAVETKKGLLEMLADFTSGNVNTSSDKK